MDVRELRVLIGIAEAGSLSAAAVKLHMTQPALSAALRRLEEELKVRLVRRHSRGAEMTEEGRLVLRRAYEVMREMAEISNIASGLSQTPVGVIRLGLPTTVAGGLIPDLVTSICKTYPRVQLYVLEAMSGVLADHIHSGQLDLAMLYDIEPRTGLNSRPVLKERLHFITHPTHPLAGAKSVRLIDVVAHPLVLPGPTHSIRRHIEAACQAEGLPLNIVADVDSLSGIINMVKKGSATILPTYRLSEHRENGSIVTTEITNPQLEWTVHLASRQDCAHPRAVQAVSELLLLTCGTLINSGQWPGATHPY